MRPPLCYICYATFEKKRVFNLVTFRKENGQKDYPPGYVGHPVNHVWFCSDHTKYAEKYSKLAFSNASKLIKQDWKNDLNCINDLKKQNNY